MSHILSLEIQFQQQKLSLVFLGLMLRSFVFKFHCGAFTRLKWSLGVVTLWSDWLYFPLTVQDRSVVTRDRLFKLLTLTLDLNHKLFQEIFMTVSVCCFLQKASILNNSLSRSIQLWVDSVNKRYCHNWDLALLAVFNSRLLNF